MAIRKDIEQETPIILYVLIDPENNLVRYVGWTSRLNIIKRLKEHLKESRSGTKTHKCNWIRYLLSKNIIPEIIEIEKSYYKNRKEREQYWIKFYGRENLVNGTDGGDGVLGLIVSDETKSILSEKSKEQMKKPGAKEFLSKIATEQWASKDARKILSDKAKELWKSDEFRKKQKENNPGNIGEKNGMFGRTHSLDARKKISDARKGSKRSDETKEKTAMSTIGVKKKNSTSKYFGVSLHNKTRWKCKIRWNRESILIGYFEIEEDAARAYDAKCFELYGSQAKLNFPENYNL